MANILVTGGCGFIGHRVVSLLKDQFKVITIDNFLGANKSVYDSRKTALTNVINYNTNINDLQSVDSILEKHTPNIIIHLASYPRQAAVTNDPIGATRTMSEGLVNLLECAKKYGTERFVYISSSMVYGDFSYPVTEYNHCNPKGLYGILKLAGENIVKDYANSFEHVIIRPSAVYGPGDDDSRVISKFLHSAINNAEIVVSGATETLDFTYIDDVAQGIVLAALNVNAKNNTYNLTRGEGRTLLDAAQLAVKYANSGIITIKDRNNSFPTRGALNISKAKADLGFNPTVDIEEGIKRYYACLNNSIYRT